MDRRRAAGTLLALAACLATSQAAPTATSNSTALDLYDEVSEGCYYNFQHYGEGDRIMTNEPCLNCTCHNRMLMCYLKVCPFTKAIGQDCTVEKRADQCCPIVTCPDVPVDLLTSTSTSSPAEYGGTGVGKIDKYGCSINGKYFPEGAKVPPTPNKPCEHCYCIRNMTTCVMQECTLHVDGCTPIYHKDVCCPVRYFCDHPEDEMPLLDDMTTTVRPTPGFLLTTIAPTETTQTPETTTLPAKRDCVENDQLYPDGALIKTDKPCQHCYCMKGDIVCVVQECGTPMENEGKNCTSVNPREGQCCPDTYICEGDELSVEPTAAMPDEDLTTTTIPPSRRVSVEGSGYRNEDEILYTEAPMFATELEGSGEEDLTERPEITTAKSELVDKFGPTDESEFIPKTTGSTFIDESEKATTEPDKGLNTVPSDDEESTKPSLIEKSTSMPVLLTTESSQEYETTPSEVTEKKEQGFTPELPGETGTLSYEKKETEPTVFEEPTTVSSGVQEQESEPSKTTLPQEEENVTEYPPTSGDESQKPEDQTKPSISETPLATEIPQTTEHFDTEREGLTEVQVTTESTITPIIDVLSETSESDFLTTPKGNLEDKTELPHTDLTTDHEIVDDHTVSEQPTVPDSVNKEQSTKPSLLEETAAKDEIQSTESPSFTEQQTETLIEHSSTPAISQKATTRADFETTNVPITEEEHTFLPTTVKEDGPLTSPESVTTLAAEEATKEILDMEHITVSPAAEKDEQQITTALPTEESEIDKNTIEPVIELSTFAHVNDKGSVTPTIIESQTVATITEKVETMESTTASEAENEIRPPGRIPGEGDCLLEGITYKNDSKVPNTNKCQTGCKCISSIIKCDPIICSSAPEDMANCQPRYDTPESCCPTYICDHGMETIPPQAQSHITGTESPTSSPAVPCAGDQCQVSEDKQEPTVPFRRDECDGEDCKLNVEVPSEGCTGSTCELPQQTPEKDIQKATEDCIGDACEPPQASPQPPVQTIPQEIPVQVPESCNNLEDCKELSVPTSCEGSSCPGEVQGSVCDQEKGCSIEPEIPPPKIIPQLCGTDGECKPVNVPVPEKPTCEGESCSAHPSHEAEPTKCDGDKCADEELGNKFGCSGDECLQQQPLLPTQETAFTGSAATEAVVIETTSPSVTIASTEIDIKEQEPSIHEDTSDLPQYSTSATKESEIPSKEASEKTTEETPKLTEGPIISDEDKKQHLSSESPFPESELSQGTTLSGIFEKTEVTKTPETIESYSDRTTAKPEEESEKPITDAVTVEEMTTAKSSLEEKITETPAVSVSESQDNTDDDQNTVSPLDIETKSPYATGAPEQPIATEPTEEFETKHTTERQIQPQATEGYTPEVVEEKITSQVPEVTKEIEGETSTLTPELAYTRRDSTESEEEPQQSSEPAVSSAPEPSVTEKPFTESETESHTTERQHIEPELPEKTTVEPYEEQEYSRTTSITETVEAEISTEKIIDVSLTEYTDLETKQPEIIHTDAPITQSTEEEMATKEPIAQDVEKEATEAPEVSPEKDESKSPTSQETPHLEDFTREGELSTQEPQKSTTEPSITEKFETKQPQVEPTKEENTEQPEKFEMSTEQTKKATFTESEITEEFTTGVVQLTTEAVPESATTITPEGEKEVPAKSPLGNEPEEAQTFRPEDKQEESATTIRLENEEQEPAQLTTPESKFEEPAQTSRPEIEQEEEPAQTSRPQGEQTEVEKQEPSSTTQKEIENKEPASTSQPAGVTEGYAPTSKPEGQSNETTSTSKPDVEQLEPTSTSKPERGPEDQPSQTSRPESVTEDYVPTSGTESEPEKATSTLKPMVDEEETASTSTKPEREPEEPALTTSAESVTEDYVPTSRPEGVPEYASTSRPEGKPEEATSTSKPVGEEEESALTVKPEMEQEEPSPTSKPESEPEIPTPTLEPEVEHEEALPTSKPGEHEAETSRPDGEPTSRPKVEQEEPASTAQPESEPNETLSTSEPKVEQEESTSTVKPQKEQQELASTESEPEEPLTTSRSEAPEPTLKPEIEQEESASTSQPDTKQEEIAETSRPGGDLEETVSTSRPERLPEEFTPTLIPGIEEKEPSVTLRPEEEPEIAVPTVIPEVEEEPASTSKMESETEKSTATFKPEVEQEVSITTFKPEDHPEKLATTAKAEVEEEELAITSKPQSELEEPAPTPITTDRQGEPELTYLPDLHTSSPESISPEYTSEGLTPTSSPQTEQSETTPYVVELELHTHKMDEEPTFQPSQEPTTSTSQQESTERLPSDQFNPELTEEKTERPHEGPLSTAKPLGTEEPQVATVSQTESEKTSEPSLVDKFGTTPKQPTAEEEFTTVPSAETEKVHTEKPIPTHEITTQSEQEVTAKPLYVPVETTAPEEEFIPVTSKVTTAKTEQETTTQTSTAKPEEKPSDIPEIPKPEEQPQVDEDFPPTGGYNQEPEPDYGEEDQAFGPGTCRYGGKVYVSAQQIPRDDPCDFCFCFRSDIICLQQSCPPPIHGCHEEPIQGFCCPRYECPVSMATSLNVTTTTTTTTTTLPPHFLPHAYKGAAQRKGCQIKGHTYQVGEVVRASSGPCLHCTCGGDGQMKCDPKACTPEPMLRQMIAAAVSAKRRR